MKQSIKFWFWLIIGAVLISAQTYRYLTNSLIFEWREAVVLFIGLMLMIKPTALPDFILKFFNKK